MHTNQKPHLKRLQSLDALRGFDMFWIISGEGLIHSWASASDNSLIDWMSDQLHHSDWNGFTFYDLIFPLFIFIAGVSMPYSMGKQLEGSSAENKSAIRQKILWHLLKRTLILIILGMVVNGLLKWQGYDNTRFASVLGRIALSCFFAGLIFLYCNLRGQLLWFAGLLIGYWVVMKFIPVPGFGAGVLTPEGNMEAYIDRILLPGKLHRKVYDPEGFLSTIPAIANALMGIFTGQFLRWSSIGWTPLKKGFLMIPVGLLLIGIAWIWHLDFPINKNMWTSSFVLLTCGWSLLFLSTFYLIIDVAGFQKWSMPLVWIGMNSITIYMASHGVIDFEHTTVFLFGGLIKFAEAAWQPVWLAAGIVAVQLGFLYFLYQQKWFLKV
ncbi:DUF5009 domain-containing protein [Xanthocytophaga agilis]|uniref:DUF5009 domain-containing protein n=1 Tax=Xanthocytophaga agilis TaxID=3048010 RepID=A0AAE3UD61_9BACT|nr:DUF5009 domain-containing protein [Xanthocytophaga agilis]MDJ1501523.1 DUF5009 domain-containing protein [Xanthocytophaga agilis]